MKKNKIRHYKTLSDALFTQELPDGKTGGETNLGDDLEGIKTQDHKEMLDKVLDWMGENDDV